MFVNERRLVVDDAVDERIWISNDAGGVWSSYGQALGAVNEVVGSVELWSAAWKWSLSVVVVAEWNDQVELDLWLRIGSVVVDW